MTNKYRSEFPYTDPIFLKHINKPIRNIVELGSNKYQYTYNLLEVYNPDAIYAFEASQKCKDYCINNTTDSRIHFISKAVCTYDGVIPFYGFGFDEDTTCSSVYERSYLVELQEPEIQVECTRLDTFFKYLPDVKIDLLCMDIQGSELSAMQSLGSMLQDIPYVILELPNPGMNPHKNCPVYEDYIQFFDANGYRIVDSIYENDWETNVMVVRE
jgi:FkbM family methyltransferase